MLAHNVGLNYTCRLKYTESNTMFKNISDENKCVNWGIKFS